VGNIVPTLEGFPGPPPLRDGATVMNRRLLGALLLVAPLVYSMGDWPPAQASDVGEGAGTERLPVRLYNDAGISQAELSAAEGVASDVLRRAGIQLLFRDCAARGPDADPLGYETHARSTDLILHVVVRFNANAQRIPHGALGYSIIPYNGELATKAYICYSCMRVLLSAFRVPELTGLAMAHEIGHLLFHSNEHSHRGIMKAVWQRADLEEGYWDEFRFTRDQAKRLQTSSELRARSSAQTISPTCSARRRTPSLP
jgi:hypothetical protein